MAKNASKDKSGAKKPEAVQADKADKAVQPAKAALADVAPASVRSSAIHIGISDKDRAAIAKGLSALLADTYTLYLTDRKSTRSELQSPCNLVCRLLLE